MRKELCELDFAAYFKGEGVNKKTPFVSKQEIPPEAEPVKFAQHLFLSAIVFVLALNFIVEGASTWLFPVSIPFAAYYAFSINKTGYAIGQHAVYSRDKNPLIFKAHMFGAICYMLVAFAAWVGW